MSRKTLGSLMESRNPANEPSQEMKFNQAHQTFYNFETLTPRRVKFILQMADSRGRLDMIYKLYDDMEVTDTRYSGILNQLRSTIAGMPLRVIPATTRTETENKFAKEFKTYAEEAIANLDSHTLTQEFVEPYIRGASLFKLNWEEDSLPFNRSMWLPESIEKVDGRFLRENVDGSDDAYGEIEVRLAQTGKYTPVSDLPDDNHLLVEDGLIKGKHSRAGVARKIVPWYIGLRFVRTWWIQYIENYATPMRVAKYPMGAKRSKRLKMEKFLKKLGRNGYGLFPQGMEVQLIEANKNDNVDTYGDFINMAHQEYNIHILGQTGTTGEGREGSMAQTIVLNGIRMDILQNVAKIVAKSFQKLVEKGLRLNYGDVFEDKKHLMPNVKPILLNSRNSKDKAQAAKILSRDMGLPVPESYLYEDVLGVEEPQEGESAVVNGELFTLGEDDMPEPKQQQTPNNPPGGERDQRGQDVNESDGENSAAG